MDVIVLIKYVADIERVPTDAWDLETGTLKRGRLRMVANPLDDHALACAKTLRADAGTIVALSMGPSSAERVCRRAVAYGADSAILLSDRAFAGSDTLATARTLARAIDLVTEELGLTDPFIVAGMQSPDGDTAQVPAEIAAQLSVPLIPYVTSVEMRADGPTFTVMERRHHSVLRPGEGRAVVACTGYTEALPFHTTLAGMGCASSQDVRVLDRESLGMAAEETGLSGSATKVVKIESVARNRGAGSRLALDDVADPEKQIDDVLARLTSVLRQTTTDEEPAESSEASLPTPGATQDGRCMAVAEISDGSATSASLELIGETRRLADRMGYAAEALVLGDALPPGFAEAVAAAGATGVVRVGFASARADYDHHDRAHFLMAAIRRLRPSFVLIPASLTGRTVAGLAAGTMELGLTADCTGLGVVEEQNEDGDAAFRLYQTRPALGGNILATIISTKSPEMATVRAGVFPLRRFPAGRIPIQDLSVDPGSGSGLIVHRGTSPAAQEEGADTAADIVVAVGSGIGTRERLEQYVRPFLKSLERRFGRTVTLACSRAAVEADILPYPYQIGQTGKTVRPSLYIALGISGAIQHRLGMENSVTVFSVNPDPEAPIHDISRFSLIATIEEAVPLLTRALDRD